MDKKEKMNQKFRIENHIFLGLALGAYLLMVGESIINPIVLDFMFFVKFGFLPLVVFGVFHMLDWVIFRK